MGNTSLIEIGVKLVTERSLVRTTRWLFYVVCCARRQGTLSLLSQSIKLKLDTKFLWELTSDRLVSHPGKVNDSNAFSTTGISIGLVRLVAWRRIELYVSIDHFINNKKQT